MAFCSLFLASFLAASSDATVTLDAQRQLFLDDALIASSRDIIRKIHPVEKFAGNPVIKPTEPWEGKHTWVYGSVILEHGKYRIWYLTDAGVGYAESVDGIAWTKPPLGIVSIDCRDTNLVIRQSGNEGEPGVLPYYHEMFGVLRDDRDPDPARLYKMAFLSIQKNYDGPREDPFHPGQRRGLGVAASPDGLHWKLVNNWTTEAICDGASHWMFDPARNKYVFYGRTKYIAPEVVEKNARNDWFPKYSWGRSVARVESNDFLNWDVTEPGKGPVVMTSDANDPAGTEIYSMLVFPYEGVYIGLVQVFHLHPDDHTLDIQLAVSRDGVHFKRVGDRSPFIPLGRENAWDRFNQSLATNPPIAVGNELRFYYGGRTYRHSPYSGPDPGTPGSYIGFGTIARDRFVSLSASEEGHFVLKPMRMSNARLHLNAKADAGAIVVKALDAQGHVLAVSKPISTDGLDVPVVWEQGDLNRADAPVTLQITIRNAQLFALWSAD